MDNKESESSTSSYGSTSVNGVTDNEEDKRIRKETVMVSRKISTCRGNSENMLIYAACNKDNLRSSLLNADPSKKDMILAQLQNVIRMCTSRITLASKGTSTVKVSSPNKEILEWVQREHLVLERFYRLMRPFTTFENIKRQKENLEQIEKLIKRKIKLENEGGEKKKDSHSKHNKTQNKSLQVCLSSLVSKKIIKKIVKKSPTSTQTISTNFAKRIEKSVQECSSYRAPLTSSVKIQVKMPTASKSTKTSGTFDHFSYVSPSYYENFKDNINKSNSNKGYLKVANKKFVDKSSQIRYIHQDVHSSRQSRVKSQEVVARSPRPNSIKKLSYVMSFTDSSTKLGEPYIESFDAESFKSGQSSAFSGFTRSFNPTIISEGTSTSNNSSKLNRNKEVSFYKNLPPKEQACYQPHSRSIKQDYVGDAGPNWGKNFPHLLCNNGDQKSKFIKQQNYNQNPNEDRVGDFHQGLLKSAREKLFYKREPCVKTIPTSPELYASPLHFQDLKHDCNDPSCILCQFPRTQVRKSSTQAEASETEEESFGPKPSPVRCIVRSPSFNDNLIPKGCSSFAITPNPTLAGQYTINKNVPHTNVDQSGNLISRPDSNINNDNRFVYIFYEPPIRL